MKITREPLFSDLVAFATTGNGVVIGRPGAGKTFALRELSRRLKEQAVSHLLLPVERLGQASPAEITALFQREGDFGGILRDAVGNKGPGVLIFDGYDAARGENERSGVFQLIARAVTVPPVKATPSMPACPTSAAPTVAPSPGSRASRSGSSPAA